MSKLSQLRKAIGYEKSAARCGNCESYTPSKMISGGKLTMPICKRFDFGVKPSACCDWWLGAGGDVLDCGPSEQRVIEVERLRGKILGVRQ